MERTITGTVGEVKGRTVNTKYGEKTVFDITIGSQKTSTFKSEIAEEANALKGSDVEATVREEQRGDYTNYMLLGVKLVDAYPAAAQNGSSSTNTIPVTTAPAADTRQASIERQTSLKAAANVFAGSGQNAAVVTAEAEAYFAWLRSEDTQLKRLNDPTAVATAAETNDGVEW